mmetsp:Transcript_3903/g.7871  ORF Transcript_3903/g.7871 Transcript_3903/m.7871 type:complete len:543 (+) Transcript_3903:45-1673(+)
MVQDASQSRRNQNTQRQLQGGSAMVPATHPFRTLVVVPGSHTDGTFEHLCGAGSRHAQGDVWCVDKSVAKRAVQLDLRPDPGSNGHRSLLITWDSRLVHQGHTHMAGTSGFNPPLFRPQFIPAADDAAWLGSLERHGFATIADVLPPEDVTKALELLLCDLQHFEPHLRSLAEVREHHLPHAMGANDLRASAGLPHGKFAWFVRTHRGVKRAFERLFARTHPGEALTGSVDVVALAPPFSTDVTVPAKQWLHLDYSPPQGRIFQACLQLFPETVTAGASWERIAVMVSKAPAAWAKPNTHRSLLSCCITGAASRATAGVTRGLIHSRRGSPQLSPSGRRLLPELACAPFALLTVGADGKVDSTNVPYCGLRLAKPMELARTMSLEQLCSFLPQLVQKYITHAVVLSPQRKMTPPPLLPLLASPQPPGSQASSAMIQKNCIAPRPTRQRGLDSLSPLRSRAAIAMTQSCCIALRPPRLQGRTLATTGTQMPTVPEAVKHFASFLRVAEVSDSDGTDEYLGTVSSQAALHKRPAKRRRIFVAYP